MLSIINPLTNEKYGLNTEMGKRILKEYIKFYQTGGEINLEEPEDCKYLIYSIKLFIDTLEHNDNINRYIILGGDPNDKRIHVIPIRYVYALLDKNRAFIPKATNAFKKNPIYIHNNPNSKTRNKLLEALHLFKDALMVYWKGSKDANCHKKEGKKSEIIRNVYLETKKKIEKIIKDYISGSGGGTPYETQFPELPRTLRDPTDELPELPDNLPDPTNQHPDILSITDAQTKPERFRVPIAITSGL